MSNNLDITTAGNFINGEEWMTLHRAAREGRDSAVEALLDQGADPNARNGEQDTPLHLAALKGHVTVVETLLNRGADFDARNTDEETALSIASHRGYEPVVEALLKKMDTASMQDSVEDNSLHLAAGKGHKIVVEMLLSKGFDINALKDDRTPLQRAAYGGHVAVVELLCNKGADIHSRNLEGDTALSDAAYAGHRLIAEKLLEKGAVIDTINQRSNTPLHGAAYCGHLSCVELFLRMGADPNIVDWVGEASLHKAASEGHEAVVSLLLDRGMETNLENQYKETPLHHAAYNGHVAVVETLLSKGAIVHIENQAGETPLSLALASDQKQVMHTLLRYGAYCYKHTFYDQSLCEHWKEITIDTEADQATLSFYTSWLLVGARSEDQELPDTLQKRQKRIIEAMHAWLEPLHLSIEQASQIIPDTLKAFPRLIHWLKRVKQVELLRAEEEDSIDPFYTLTKIELEELKHFLLIPKSETEGGRITLVRGLLDKMPVELLALIRERLIEEIVVEPLIRFYSLPYFVAYYLVRDGRVRLENYIKFHKELFQHGWEIPYTPLANQSPSQITSSNLMLY